MMRNSAKWFGVLAIIIEIIAAFTATSVGAERFDWLTSPVNISAFRISKPDSWGMFRCKSQPIWIASYFGTPYRQQACVASGTAVDVAITWLVILIVGAVERLFVDFLSVLR